MPKVLPLSAHPSAVPCQNVDALTTDQVNALFSGGGTWVFEELLRLAAEGGVHPTTVIDTRSVARLRDKSR